MTFRVGQKVVCVDDEAPDSGVYPVLDEIYTVCWSGFFDHPIFGITEACVHLKEIDRPTCIFGMAIPYKASRFRPIVERKTEVSFTTGADPSSDQFDNRRRVKVGVSA